MNKYTCLFIIIFFICVKFNSYQCRKIENKLNEIIEVTNFEVLKICTTKKCFDVAFKNMEELNNQKIMELKKLGCKI